VKKYGRATQYVDGNIIQFMRYTCWMTTKAADTYTEYVILIIFP